MKYACVSSSILIMVELEAYRLVGSSFVGRNRSNSQRRIFVTHRLQNVGRGSSVGTATNYRLDGLEIESRTGRDFSQPSGPTPRSTQSPIRWVPGVFPGGEEVGAWR